MNIFIKRQLFCEIEEKNATKSEITIRQIEQKKRISQRTHRKTNERTPIEIDR